jgi:transcriptional regulator with XRE-family HTH domain
MEETSRTLARSKQALDEKGMKAQELAETLGVGANTISKYIHEKSYPSLSVLLKSLKDLNTTADFLIGAGPCESCC